MLWKTLNLLRQKMEFVEENPLEVQHEGLWRFITRFQLLTPSRRLYAPKNTVLENCINNWHFSPIDSAKAKVMGEKRDNSMFAESLKIKMEVIHNDHSHLQYRPGEKWLNFKVDVLEQQTINWLIDNVPEVNSFLSFIEYITSRSLLWPFKRLGSICFLILESQLLVHSHAIRHKKILKLHIHSNSFLQKDGLHVRGVMQIFAIKRPSIHPALVLTKVVRYTNRLGSKTKSTLSY